MGRHRAGAGAGGPGAAPVALAGCVLTRPGAFGGGVEICAASPAPRGFPTRISEGLGVCLKTGPAHTVTCEGRALTYPADAICVRLPGCVWESEAAAVGFLSVDVAPRLLPRGPRDSAGLGARMRFLPRAALPDLRRLVAGLQAGEGPLSQQGALAELVAALGACGVLDADELRAGADRRGAVERAQEFLAARVEANPTLDDLAAAVGANKFVLLRRFRRELGTTPHGYLLRLRVERARALLARGAGPTAAAAAAGFADLSHLTRHFKRIVGLPPGSYARPGRAGIPLSVSS